MCKSTVDWCENNYEVTEYIAEFWNTISGACIFLSSLYFYMSKNDQINITKYNKYFKNINIKLTIVSVGTILFHSTLLYKYQLLDEIPMIWVVIEYIKILSRLRTTKMILNNVSLLCIEFMIIICLPITCLLPFTYKISGDMQKISFGFVFIGYSGILIWILKNLSYGLNKCVYMEINGNREKEKVQNNLRSMIINKKEFNKYNMLKETQNNLKQYIEERKVMSVYIKRVKILGIMSISCWVIERVLCKNIKGVQMIQFHAWWHILSSLGIYNLNNIILKHAKISEIIELKDKLLKNN